MPRNMSFMLTTQQIKNKTKTVTRRLGWKNLKEGDIINACVKCMGLKRGQKVDRLCQIRIISVCREHLKEIRKKTNDLEAEGFPELLWWEFIVMFCDHNKGCTEETIITRIEFEYL